MKHCDEYIEDPAAPAPLRRFLERARQPGHGMLSPEPFPKLYADHKGMRVRVVMASRFGDVGITYDLKASLGMGAGYQERCSVVSLSNFSETP